MQDVSAEAAVEPVLDIVAVQGVEKLDSVGAQRDQRDIAAARRYGEFRVARRGSVAQRQTREGLTVPTSTDIQSNAPNGAKPWLTRGEAVQYLRDMGFVHVTEHTITYHVKETGKLPRPKRIARQSYWNRADLDKLVDSL